MKSVVQTDHHCAVMVKRDIRRSITNDACLTISPGDFHLFHLTYRVVYWPSIGLVAQGRQLLNSPTAFPVVSNSL